MLNGNKGQVRPSSALQESEAQERQVTVGSALLCTNRAPLAALQP